ncbi:MAG: hypothetical protein ACREHD_03560, partial [Pirellulales bacterium]
MAIRLLSLGVALGFYLAIAAARADEKKPSAQWPQFRGLDGQGAAAGDAQLPIEFGPSKNVLWKTPLPLGHSSPCVWNDRVFLTAADSDERRLITICVHRETGEVLWERSVTVEKLE